MKTIATLTILCLIVSSFTALAMPEPIAGGSRHFWEPVPFVRGDINTDNTVNLADIVILLEYMFGGQVDRGGTALPAGGDGGA